MSSIEVLRSTKRHLLKSLGEVQKALDEATGSQLRILYVAPHLSTGGMPQYLLKLIEIFNSQADVYCLEYSNISDEYVVQRNKIQKLLGNRYYRIDDHEDKSQFLEILDKINPDVIHFQDFVEFFLDRKICEHVYAYNRPWYIMETPHSSANEPNDKYWLPDKLVMVNQWMADKFSEFGVPTDVLEYPIEEFERNLTQSEAQEILGWDPGKKHVINVGLFTAGKNQGELMKFASQMLDSPVEFHFVGNQAINFQEYWQPLVSNLPGNCRLWGERQDIEVFYQAADLFVFNSTWELNPIVIKECLSWQVPILMRRLQSYGDSYDNHPLVTYLETGTSGSDFQTNLDRLKNLVQEKS
jgi:glycosyltransferase involved in cell wall biosynthesis